MKVDDMICVADFSDLCPRQVHDFVGNLSQTLSPCQKVGIMEFGLIATCQTVSSSVTN